MSLSVDKTVNIVRNTSQLKFSTSDQNFFICTHQVNSQDLEQLLDWRRQSQFVEPWFLLHNEDMTVKVRSEERIFFVHTNHNHIYESYEVNGAAVENVFARFYPEKGFQIHPILIDEFLQRRWNFHGLTFRLLVDEQAPYVNMDYDDLDTDRNFTTPFGDEMVYMDEDQMSGVYPDYIHIMKAELNIRELC